MALTASLLSAAFLAILGLHLAVGQTGRIFYTAYPPITNGRCLRAGTFANPEDCGSFLECTGVDERPFRKDCARGTLFDAEHGLCEAIEKVNCFPRPRTVASVLSPVVAPTVVAPMVRPVVAPTVYQAVAAPVISGANVAVLRLPGVLLTGDQCRAIGQQMTNYLSQLVMGLRPPCASNSPCLNNLPRIEIACNALTTARIIL